MAKKFYMPKCSITGIKRKQNTLKLEIMRLFFQFFVEGDNIYVQQNLNMNLKS